MAALAQWVAYLEVLADEKICLSCWAELLKDYLDPFIP